MIVQALCAYYDALAARGEISPPGWCEARVSFTLDLDENGSLRSLDQSNIDYYTGLLEG